jgi:DNA-binding NtrC family response regulator
MKHPAQMPLRVLVAEDDEAAQKHLQKLFDGNPAYKVETVGNGQVALTALEQCCYNVLLTDLHLAGIGGLELLHAIQVRQLPVTAIVMCSCGTIDDAVRAVRLGAYDFLSKPLDFRRLELTLERAGRERKLQNELAALRSQLQESFTFNNVVSKNPRMHAVFELINNVGHTNTTVLIEGETGTGKEQIARAIHQVSAHRSGPLVVVNCAALSETLLESELFGHEKGAFTNAIGQRKGRFEIADRGTVFLDEVGDVPPGMQAKLLRVLQERRFERVGGTESIEVDVRVIAATNRPLRRLVKHGKFREDLFYRLNVIRIELPSLRERMEDIPLLAAHFLQKYGRPGDPAKQLTALAMQALMDYRWPGNIRELENVIERAIVTSRGDHIDVAELASEVTQPCALKFPYHIPMDRPLPDVVHDVTANIEKQYLRQALTKTHGSVVRTAKITGMSRRSVTAKIAEYQIDRGVFKNGKH